MDGFVRAENTNKIIETKLAKMEKNIKHYAVSPSALKETLDHLGRLDFKWKRSDGTTWPMEKYYESSIVREYGNDQPVLVIELWKHYRFVSLTTKKLMEHNNENSNEILTLDHLKVALYNLEGPTRVYIPAREFQSCSGCKHYSYTMARSGMNPEYRQNCEHHEAPKDYSFTGNLKVNSSGDQVTPDWCPVLNPKIEPEQMLQKAYIESSKWWWDFIGCKLPQDIQEKIKAEHYFSIETENDGKVFVKLKNERIDITSVYNMPMKTIFEFYDYSKLKK